VKKGKRGAASGHTLQEAIALFLARYKKKSAETYGYNLKNFSNFTGADRPISGITEMHILEYQRDVESRPIKTATKATYLKMVKVFFNWLTKTKLINRSPAHLLKVPRTTSHIEKKKAMTDEELRKILDWAKWKPRDHAIILFLADTGCRAGGAAGLRIGDIDWQGLQAVVTEKGEKTRPVSFGPTCAAALHAWLKKRPPDAGEYVFSVTQVPVKAAIISNAVRRASVRAGCRSLGSHSLRHRMGHQLAYAMTPPSLAARIMGHERADTTFESYYPTSWEEADKVIRSFAVKDEDTSSTPASQEKPEPKPRLIVLKKGG
jgi:integrase